MRAPLAPCLAHRLNTTSLSKSVPTLRSAAASLVAATSIAYLRRSQLTALASSLHDRGMTEWELWACANKLRQEHGVDARIEAAKRCVAMHEANDHAGYSTWSKILDCVELMDYVVATEATKH